MSYHNRSDNRPENLDIMTIKEHGLIQQSINDICMKWFIEEINNGNIVYNKEDKNYKIGVDFT